MAPSTLKSQWWNWVARQKIDPHLPIHGLRDSFGTWVYETYGVKQAQEWLGHSDPATTLRHYVRLTTAARAKAVAGLDEVTRAALEGGRGQTGGGMTARSEQRRRAIESTPLDHSDVSLRFCPSQALALTHCFDRLRPEKSRGRGLGLLKIGGAVVRLTQLGRTALEGRNARSEKRSGTTTA